MFLQRYKYQNPSHNSPSPTPSHISHKLQEVTKKRISVPEIRSHQKKQNYLNPRTFLIEHTQKVFKGQPNHKPRQIRSVINPSRSQDQATSFCRQTHFEQKCDLSKRESRTMAARLYRERIWKGNDISSLLRAQEQLNITRRSENLQRAANESAQKVQRYRDLLKEFGEETSIEKRQKIKKEWLMGAIKNNNSYRLNTNSKNPQLQVTNIEFMDNIEENQSVSKVLTNRQRRKQLIRRSSHISYSMHNKRPNTTSGYTQRNEENIIEPW